jgi:antitoxin component YwqK of YwqJK toxin-antitoxin module
MTSKQSTYETWYENGQLRERGFYGTGKCETWYENGQIQQRIFYLEGFAEGKYRE